MKAICITCDPSGDRYLQTRDHLLAGGIDVTPFVGLDNRAAGLETTYTYDVDHPGTNYHISGATIGIALSHWMLWGAMQMWDEDEFLVFEDDARWAPGGQERLKQAWNDVPNNWDVFYVGSCCASGKTLMHITGNVYDVRYPLCTHAYAIKKSAAMRMLSGHTNMFAPVDISMCMCVYQSTPMNVYTVLPRVFEQNNTYIPE